jgi:hypothetical protein
MRCRTVIVVIVFLHCRWGSKQSAHDIEPGVRYKLFLEKMIGELVLPCGR